MSHFYSFSKLCLFFSFAAAFVLYFLLGYVVVRDDFVSVFLVFSGLFGLYVVWFFTEMSTKKWFVLGIAIRLLLLLMLPNLSQDFYRFLWDGRMLLEGWNPYIHMPHDLMQNTDFIIGNKQELYNGMGNLSASHYSNYPPINQLFFIVAGVISPNNILGGIVVLRLSIIAGDCAIFFGLHTLCKQNKINSNWALLYFLNPLVLIELTGNLHFEGVMMAFFIWGIILFYRSKPHWSSLLYAFSIATKLLPLMLLPLFIRGAQWKRTLIFYAGIGTVCIALFAPFISLEFFTAYQETIGLWFVNFEFNASIYYLIREVGFYVKGYNIIQTVGRITPFVLIAIICTFAFLGNNQTQKMLLRSCLWILVIYFGISTTVHPWYILNVLVLGIATGYLFPILWTFLVVLSYSAYSGQGFQESMLLITLEYFILLIGIIAELIIKNKNYYSRLRDQIFRKV